MVPTFSVILQSRNRCLIVFLVTFCVWLFGRSNSHQPDGGNSILALSREKQSSWLDDSNSLSGPRADTSSFARVKRQTDAEMPPLVDGAVEAKSSQPMRFSPTLACFYPPSGSINPDLGTAGERVSSPICVKLHLGSNGLPFVPIFLPQQLEDRKRAMMHITIDHNNRAQPISCYESRGDSPTAGALPFHCTHVPAPPTFQFPVMPGISDFDSVLKESDKANEDGLLGAKYSNPYAHVFRELTNDCPANHRRCADGSRCVPSNVWCNRFVDCPDASDESECSCRERISKAKLCDNYHDCPHGEDELGCFGCPKNSFSCNDDSATHDKAGCLLPEQRCDGVRQCANGRDELGCSILAQSYTTGNEMFPVGFGVGFLQKNSRGRWYPVCEYALDWAIEACTYELGASREKPSIQMVPNPSHGAFGPYMSSQSRHLVEECPNQVTYVRCPRPPGGSRSSRDGEGSPSGRARASSSDDPMLSIVGGHESSPRAWPSILAIYKNGRFHCGGVVLNEYWLLSAAHCFTDFQQHYYEVEAGLLRRFSFSPGQQSRSVAGVVIHPSFKPMTLQNDVALGLLSKPLLFNSWVRPVRLPEPDTQSFFGWRKLSMPGPRSVCYTVGWGATREGGPDPDHLREVEVPLTECKYREDRNPAEICAGLRQGGRDACQGDSGGPLMCRWPNTINEWYVAGVVSHGVGCGRQYEPGAYTKVSYFVNWINSITESATPAVVRNIRAKCPGFSCSRASTKCLPAGRRCDMVADCLGAEDEMNCASFVGAPHEPTTPPADSS